MNALRLPAVLTAVLLTAGSGAATAATLGFSITNLAPAGSLSIEPALFQNPPPGLTDVILTAAGGGMMEVIPQLGFQFGLGTPGAMFPFAGGGAALPALFPGDTLTFTLMDVDLLGQGALHFGISLFTQTAIADGAGTLTGASLTLTAGSLAEFAANGGGPPLLVLPDSMMPGPASIAPGTPLLRLTVVPEPSALLLTLATLSLALRRRRR